MRAWAPEHEEPAEKDTVRDDTGRTDADGLEPFIRGESYIETGQEARADANLFKNGTLATVT